MVAVCVAAAPALAQYSRPPTGPRTGPAVAPATVVRPLPSAAPAPSTGLPVPEALTGSSANPLPMQISGTAVRVRSGPGTYFYELSQLNEPTQVETYGREHGWTAIRPPSKVVALVKKSDVLSTDGVNGVVTVTSARVYAKDPVSGRTWAVIAQLPRDESVKILRTEDDRYAIEMPKGAHVYVDSTLLKPVSTGTTMIPGLTGELPKIKPLEVDPEEKSFNAAMDLLEAEMQKPLAERDFSKAEEALKAVAGKVKVVYLLSEVEEALGRIAFQKELQEGLKKKAADARALEAELAAIRAKEEALIAKTRQAPLDVDRKPQFTGVMKQMLARMTYKYRIEDAAGNYLCMIEGDDGELAQFVGKTVRVWGETKYRTDLKMTILTVKSIEEAK